MSKGKDFRGPRKRGFDDDGPMSYDSRPSRTPRPSFGGPSSGGFGGGDLPPPTTPPVDAVVKWFKGDKGFGFVELGNGSGDAFLHIGALQTAGYESVPPGTKLKVQVGQGQKGTQVTRVLEVDTSTATAEAPRSFGGDGGGRSFDGGGRSYDGGGGGRSFDSPRPPRRMPDPSTAVEVSGTVKWFDETKGFGFVSSSDGGKDVFVHISVLRPAGIMALAEGQTINMRVVDTPKGREAISIEP